MNAINQSINTLDDVQYTIQQNRFGNEPQSGLTSEEQNEVF